MLFADLVTLFIAPLNAVGLRYAVTGGVATIAYGVPRLTNDVDVIVELPPASVRSLLGAFASDDFASPPEEVAVREAGRLDGGHFNVIHIPSAQKVDFYPAGGDALRAWALEGRERHRIAGTDVWLAPREYVIVAKLEWHRGGGTERHLRDVRAILEYGAGLVNEETLKVWVERRELGALLEAARRLALGG